MEFRYFVNFSVSETYDSDGREYSRIYWANNRQELDEMLVEMFDPYHVQVHSVEITDSREQE